MFAMRRTRRAAVAVVALVITALGAAGCQSEGLTTRSYPLARPQTDTAVINSVLQEEWTRHLGRRTTARLHQILTQLREITDPYR